MMLVMLLMFLLLPGVGLAQSKEAAEVTLFEGQGLMQALVDAGYDFRLYTELRKVSPDGNAVECGSPSGFEIRTMHPQILWLPAGAKVNQTRLKQCLAVENELFGNKQTIVHQPTQKPRAVRIPVPKPAPAPPVATPKKQPAPKRKILEAQPVAPANKQPAPKPVAAVPKVQTKVLDQKSLRELEREMGSDLGKSSRLVPPAPPAKKPEPSTKQQVIQKPQSVVKVEKRPDALLREYKPRIAAQRREIDEFTQKAAKQQAEAARMAEIRWVNENNVSKVPSDLPYPWRVVWIGLLVGFLFVALLIFGLKFGPSVEAWLQKRVVNAKREKAAQISEDNSQVVSPRAARRLAGNHPARPLSVMELDEATRIVARANGLQLVSRERNKAS